MRKQTVIIAAFAISLLLTPQTVLAQARATASPVTGAPSIKIVTPGENLTIYGNKISVLFDVQNFNIVDYQNNTRVVAGQGHIHLWLDDEKPTAESATKVTSEEFEFTDIAPGEHTLRAELVNNNHSPLTPPKVLTIKFKNEAIASPSPVNGNSFDQNTALVILVIVSLVILTAWWYTKEDNEPVPGQKSEAKKPAAKKKTIKKKTTRKARR